MNPKNVGPYGLLVRRILMTLVGIAAVGIAVVRAPALVLTLFPEPDPLLLVAYLLLLALPLSGAVIAGIMLRRDRVLTTTAPLGHRTPSGHSTADQAWFFLTRAALVVYVLTLTTAIIIPHAPEIPDGALASYTAPVIGASILAATISPLALKRRDSLIFTVLLLPVMFIHGVANDVVPLHTAAGEALLFTASNLLFLATISWGIQSVDHLDRTRFSREEQETRLSAERHLSLARRAANDHVHDHILSALVPVAQGLTDFDEIRASARMALESLHPPRMTGTPSSVTSLALSLNAQMEKRQSGCTLQTLISEDILIPAEVAMALREATFEALSNVHRHAGTDPARPDRPVPCRTVITANHGMVRIVIADDGRGFDPAALPDDRHGIRHSILARMERAGGTATVGSTPGAGTMVTLMWSLPAGNIAPDSTPLPVTPVSSAYPHVEPVPATSGLPAWDARLAPAVESLTARAVVAFALGANTLVAIMETMAGFYINPVPVAFALVATYACAIALVRSWPNSALPPKVGPLIATTAAAINVIALGQITDLGWPDLAGWTIGTGFLLACGLIMRERPWSAWSTVALMVLSTAVWVLATDRPAILIVTTTIGHVLTVAIWHTMAIWSARISQAVTENEDAVGQALRDRRVQEQMDAEQESHMRAVARRARPVLRRIAQGPITPEVRSEAFLLEAELRDEIRAPFFTGTSVVPEARAARIRGVEVLLVDDSSGAPLPEPVRWSIIANATEALRTTGSGRVVIRVFPTRRRVAATILSNDKLLEITMRRLRGADL